MWKALTGLAILVIGALLVGMIWLTSSVLGYLQPVLIPLAVAGIVAYLLDPVVRFLQSKGLSRIRGIIVVFLGFTLFFGILSYFVGHKLTKQVRTLVESTDGSLINAFSTPEGVAEAKDDGLTGWILRKGLEKDTIATENHLEAGGSLVGLNKDKWHIPRGETELNPVVLPNVAPPENAEETRMLLESDWTREISIGDMETANNLIALENFRFTKMGHWLFSTGDKILGWLSNSSGKVLGFLGLPLGMIMVPIYLYYFMKESEAIKEGWTDYVPLKASQFKDEVVDTVREINGYLISFFRGQVLVAFIDGILVGITLTIFQLPYGLLIGIFMAILGIIPYIGNILCLIPACVIAYFHGVNEPYGIPQWGYVFGVLAIFIIVQQINSLVTAPKIVGDSVGLHPMTVIFSMLFWSLLLGGFLGALLAVPLTAAVKVLFRRYVWDRQNPENQVATAS